MSRRPFAAFLALTLAGAAQCSAADDPRHLLLLTSR